MTRSIKSRWITTPCHRLVRLSEAPVPRLIGFDRGTLGYDAGVVGNSTFDLRPVIVTTYDSAYRHMDRIGDRFGPIVFDEAHLLPAESFREAALLCAAPFRLGLTGTASGPDARKGGCHFFPTRSDGEAQAAAAVVEPSVGRRRRKRPGRKEGPPAALRPVPFIPRVPAG